MNALLLLLIAPSPLVVQAGDYFPPEQLHINLGTSPDVMHFNWLTFDNPPQTDSFVMLGTSAHPSDFSLNISGEATVFTDCGSQQTKRTIHTAMVNDLLPSTTYFYQVGDAHHGFSDVNSFTTAPSADTLSSSLPHTFLLFGDMGTVNTQVCGPATQMVLDGEVSAVIHAGDFAYNMYENNGTTGDEFMRDIASMASNTAYMVSMGNHESYYNFSHFTQRFRGQPLPSTATNAPQSVWTQSGEAPNNWFYSFNYGLVHFVSVSSEIYFDFPWLIPAQYQWLTDDLETANQNRSSAPWIIVYHHRPLYCTGEGSECGSQAEAMRSGVDGGNYSLEAAYYKFGVDIVTTGHVHNYERTFDIYDGKTEQRTTDMTATTYLVNGDAGNREGHHTFDANASWSAYRTTAYSFSKLKIYNATHAHLQQITADSELPPSDQGAVLDDVWFVQNNHGPFEGRTKRETVTESEGVTYDPYKEYGIPMKVAPPHELRPIPFISEDKADYRGVEGVHF